VKVVQAFNGFFQALDFVVFHFSNSLTAILHAATVFGIERVSFIVLFPLGGGVS